MSISILYSRYSTVHCVQCTVQIVLSMQRFARNFSSTPLSFVTHPDLSLLFSVRLTFSCYVFRAFFLCMISFTYIIYQIMLQLYLFVLYFVVIVLLCSHPSQ